MFEDKGGIPIGVVRYAIWGTGSIARSLRNVFFALWKGYVWGFILIMLFCYFPVLQWPMLICIPLGFPFYMYFWAKWSNARDLAALKAQIAIDNSEDKVSLD